MKGLAESRLQSFKEDVLGHQVSVFGNVAVAVAGCQITENDKEGEFAGVQTDAAY